MASPSFSTASPSLTATSADEPVRHYPSIPEGLLAPTRPISFVCVKYSAEFDHNAAVSQCVRDPMNQFVVVENESNANFTTLGSAINHGIDQARHDLIVVMHEDVVLLPGWQSMFEQSLSELEAADPDWAVVGAVGWDEQKELHGHFSDPHRFENTFGDRNNAEIVRFDEQLFALKRSGPLRLDPRLPSIHNIGKDLPKQAELLGRKAYAVNAPTIHKFADGRGNRVQTASDSRKIARRSGLQHQADRQCSNEYFNRKWALNRKQQGALSTKTPHLYPPNDEPPAGYGAALRAPIILLGRGGSGTRLLSVLAQDVGLFVGSDLNVSGDSLEMARTIYRGVMRKYRYPEAELQANIVPDLQYTALRMLADSGWPRPWGYKLPESIFLLPELLSAFPGARYVFLKRDPLSMALRRAHITALRAKPIGQTTLRLAYEHLHISPTRIATDETAMRMAVTTQHQLSLLLDFKRRVDGAAWHEVDFDRLIADPGAELDAFARFCGMKAKSRNIASLVDQDRASATPEISDEVMAEIRAIVDPSRHALGYTDNGAV